MVADRRHVCRPLGDGADVLQKLVPLRQIACRVRNVPNVKDPLRRSLIGCDSADDAQGTWVREMLVGSVLLVLPHVSEDHEVGGRGARARGRQEGRRGDAAEADVGAAIVVHKGGARGGGPREVNKRRVNEARVVEALLCRGAGHRKRRRVAVELNVPSGAHVGGAKRLNARGDGGGQGRGPVVELLRTAIAADPSDSHPCSERVDGREVGRDGGSGVAPLVHARRLVDAGRIRLGGATIEDEEVRRAHVDEPELDGGRVRVGADAAEWRAAVMSHGLLRQVARVCTEVLVLDHRGASIYGWLARSPVAM